MALDKNDLNEIKKIVDSSVEDSTESLARMVNSGFNSVQKEINGMKSEMNDRLKKLEIGQEDIKLRLDNVAYRFELQNLERRVILLEKKAKF